MLIVPFTAYQIIHWKSPAYQHFIIPPQIISGVNGVNYEFKCKRYSCSHLVSPQISDRVPGIHLLHAQDLAMIKPQQTFSAI